MMGSGTTVVEAFLEGRRGLGFDINLLALRIGRIKTMALDRKGLRDWEYRVLDNGYELLRNGKEVDQFLASCFDPYQNLRGLLVFTGHTA